MYNAWTEGSYFCRSRWFGRQRGVTWRKIKIPWVCDWLSWPVGRSRVCVNVKVESESYETRLVRCGVLELRPRWDGVFGTAGSRFRLSYYKASRYNFKFRRRLRKLLVFLYIFQHEFVQRARFVRKRDEHVETQTTRSFAEKA